MELSDAKTPDLFRELLNRYPQFIAAFNYSDDGGNRKTVHVINGIISEVAGLVWYLDVEVERRLRAEPDARRGFDAEV